MQDAEQIISSLTLQETPCSLEICACMEDGHVFKKIAVLDKATGGLVSFFNKNGEDMLSEPMRLNFSRAATDNDRCVILFVIYFIDCKCLLN